MLHPHLQLCQIPTFRINFNFNGKLFEEGKRLLYDFLKQEVVEGLCLMTISNSDEEETPIPNNTSHQTCKGDILFLLIFQFLNVCFLFLIQSIRSRAKKKQYLPMSNLCSFWVSL